MDLWTKKAVCLAFDDLFNLLAPHRYFPVWESTGLWKHQTQPIVFTLCVGFFFIKANSMEDSHHLINAIKTCFKCSIVWEGQNCLGLTQYWNYTKKYVDISMPGYTPTTLQRLQHKPLARPKYAPHSWNKPVYGKHIQLATHKISAPKLNYADTNKVQSINSTFLYYARAVDPTIILVLNKISTWKSAPTQDTMDKCNQVLDYASTHPNATICYHAIYMILMTDIDATSLVLP